MMQLMTKELAAKLPDLYSQEDVDDPMVVGKWFCPWSSWTWYATEFSEVAPDGTPNLAFGLVVGQYTELGYFSLDELAEIRGPGGLTIERDLYWTPVPLSTVQQKHRAN